ncbi:dTDP-glucose 4,6-dehydratase [candidate division WS5 bacterium]|uniref:dTDP-glucose 4,6-dehydratase n=1 Tax=candidate division WS5 bacterium TaxID=2093353 RepID=A0A419DGJ7_9BACT|nr:MAG: dTDP-glucose 4,6-dehydratase [candidate division WS5 bacterium]
MKILVTGGAGFIGANFILYMLDKHPDVDIVNMDALTYAGNLENLKSVEGDKNYRFIKGDITDPKIVAEAMKGCDTVVHFAAESHVDRSILEPAIFIKTNVLGTQILLDAALKEGVKRFHHVSTDEVYGALPLSTKEKFREDTPYDPHSPYSAAKAASDHLVRAYGDTFGLPFTISNCSNNYGPYQFPEKLIPLAIANLDEGKKIPVYGDGLYVRDWLYVTDHCEAIDLILEKGKEGETYLIGGLTEDVPNIDLVKMLIKIMGKDESSIEYVKDRPAHDRRYAVDWSKINKELGWEPKHDFEQGIKDTVDWYLGNKEWWQRIRSGEYQKYYKMQYPHLSSRAER